jgi:hypothetical protein
MPPAWLTSEPEETLIVTQFDLGPFAQSRQGAGETRGVPAFSRTVFTLAPGGWSTGRSARPNPRGTIPHGGRTTNLIDWLVFSPAEFFTMQS